MGCDAAMTRAYGIAGLETSLREVSRRPVGHRGQLVTTCLDRVNIAAHTQAEMERPLGAAAAVLTWVGWLAICPALGFPILGTAAMVNRAFFKLIPDAGHQPNFWLGWAILISGLVGAIGLFFFLERRRVVRASIRTGLIYGALLWLLVGAVVMPVFGTFEARPPAAPGFQPADPMQATFMMSTLGPLAAVAALIAWLLFGAILGATWSNPSRSESAALPGKAR